MKVRVLREMPFAKVGEEFECDPDDSCYLNLGIKLSPHVIHGMINTGWLEEVKEEESLAEKIFEKLESGCLKYLNFDNEAVLKETANRFSKIAESHYFSEEKIRKCIENYSSDHASYNTIKEDIDEMIQILKGEK